MYKIHINFNNIISTRKSTRKSWCIQYDGWLTVQYLLYTVYLLHTTHWVVWWNQKQKIMRKITFMNPLDVTCYKLQAILWIVHGALEMSIHWIFFLFVFVFFVIEDIWLLAVWWGWHNNFTSRTHTVFSLSSSSWQQYTYTEHR